MFMNILYLNYLVWTRLEVLRISLEYLKYYACTLKDKIGLYRVIKIFIIYSLLLKFSVEYDEIKEVRVITVSMHNSGYIE
ncbi:hypothetical protein NEPAR06_1914 [Nematocida parisii]|nr:hypothetical protein NEPAR06_1914 [Nematocida parisii]